MKRPPEAAVVGAGLYGCMIALGLAEAGFDVDLFDAQPDILMGATRANQGRLHLGYHYPRSPVTAMAAKLGSQLFHGSYADCLAGGCRHYYALADDSRLRWKEYASICRSNELPVHEAMPTVDLDHVSGCLWAPETFLDVGRLRDRLRHDLFMFGIRLYKVRRPRRQDLDYDLVVDATYGRLGWSGSVLQFELTELVVVKMSPEFERKSIVVMDGPFGVSLDPVPGDPGLHHLYHVTHSVHRAGEDMGPFIENEWSGLMALLVDEGPRQEREKTAFQRMVADGSRYIPGLRSARYVESLFTVRAVLPGSDDTDARPSRVWQVDDRTLSVLGGKLGDSIATAQQVATLAGEICQLPTPV